MSKALGQDCFHNYSKLLLWWSQPLKWWQKLLQWCLTITIMAETVMVKMLQNWLRLLQSWPNLQLWSKLWSMTVETDCWSKLFERWPIIVIMEEIIPMIVEIYLHDCKSSLSWCNHFTMMVEIVITMVWTVAMMWQKMLQYDTHKNVAMMIKTIRMITET